MLINSHYPQVSIVTSNVATDSARVDNQQKPPIIPPQQPTKNHPERAYNQQNERTQAHNVVEQKQQQQRSTSQREAIVQQLVAPKSLLGQPLNIVANNTPTIQRKDIRIKQSLQAEQGTTQNNKSSVRSDDMPKQSSAYYQQVRQHVSQYYGQNMPTKLASIPDTI
ncbi:hypothetical protein [Shewanella sp. OMA3-2]|uniref:hypothetical protein n=1 Tax=Shewanella sp. OMA3-2 TaxID=2908650 RepID=UPI001F33463A|nr:hypothetical protein [Shewanella sp. OMA3-2]UJF22408.1 hypothetical protein L0B17_03010 [Shewanella sp. OMA3-2]